MEMGPDQGTFPPHPAGPSVQPNQTPDVLSGLRALPGQWRRVLTHPSVASFQAEQPRASWAMLWTMLIGYAILAALLGVIGAALTNSVQTFPGLSSQQAILVKGITTDASGLGVLISIPVGFFLGQGILFGLAKLFGGSGTFLDQGYLSLLYIVPLDLASTVLRFLPLLGGLIALAIAIYEIFLQIYVIQAAHRLSGGKATAVVLLPVAIAIVLIVLVILWLITPIGPTIIPH
jgi:hypothetical protein